jgi:hypothetical protein
MQFRSTFLWIFRDVGDRFAERKIKLDEANFKLIGYVSKQNSQFCAKDNPEKNHVYTVWCGIS